MRFAELRDAYRIALTNRTTRETAHDLRCDRSEKNMTNDDRQNWSGVLRERGFERASYRA